MHIYRYMYMFCTGVVTVHVICLIILHECTIWITRKGYLNITCGSDGSQIDEYVCVDVEYWDDEENNRLR